MRLGRVVVTLFCVSAPVKADPAFQGHVLRFVTILTPSSVVVGTLLKVDATEVTLLNEEGKPATMPVRWATADKEAEQHGTLGHQQVVLRLQGELVEVTEDGVRLGLATVLRGTEEGEALARFARQPDLRRQLADRVRYFKEALPGDSTFATLAVESIPTTASVPGLLTLARFRLANACKQVPPSCVTPLDSAAQARLSAAAKACRDR
jgi:hypothetical protein